MKAWFEGMIANVPGMIYRAQRCADGTVSFLYVSEGCRKLLGIEPDQLLADALTLSRLVHPEDRQSYENSGLLAEGQAQGWRWKGRIVLPSGEEKVIQGEGHPDPKDDGDVIWDGLLLNITERMKTEQNLAQLAAIVENSQDAIKSKTLDGIITSWNHAAELMYGYTAAEMIGHTIIPLLPPDRPHEIDDLLRRISHGEKVDSYETVRVTKDGTRLDVSLTMSPIKDSAGRVTGASTIVRDISERKRMTAALAAAAKYERIAETLQSSMLQTSPSGKFPGIAVKTFYQAAMNEANVGGDFFDAFALDEWKVALVVGDISGKGLIAAGRTTEVKYALRAFLHAYHAPAVALAHLNDFICETHRLDIDYQETFIILALAIVDTAIGEAVFTAAGAEPTLVLRANGRAERVEVSAQPLGILPGAVYNEKKLYLAYGETVMMATDGITEARRGNAFFGIEGIAAMAEKAGAAGSLQELSQAIYGGALAFAGAGLHDDVCVLLARRQ